MSVLQSVNATGFVLKWAAIAALLLGVYFLGRNDGAKEPRAQLAEAKADHANYAAEVARDMAELHRLAAETAKQAMVAKQRQEEAFEDIAEQHLQEKKDNETVANRVVDDLRTGRLRLQKHLAAQATTALTADVLSALPGTGQREVGTGLRPEDAAFLVRIADDADADIRARNRVIAEFEKGTCPVQAQGDAHAP